MNDIIIVWLFYLIKDNLRVTTIFVFIKTNTYLEVLSVIIFRDYCYIWLDRIINQSPAPSQADTLEC